MAIICKRSMKEREDEVGCFVWDKEFEKYEGTVDWPGAPRRVVLQSKGSSDPILAMQALQKFKRIYNSRVVCDENLRKYAKQKINDFEELVKQNRSFRNKKVY